MIFRHYSEIRSCFDTLSTNGWACLCKEVLLALSLSKGERTWITIK